MTPPSSLPDPFNQILNNSDIGEAKAVNPDYLLKSIVESEDESIDPRHCITLVSRPQKNVKDAIRAIQDTVRQISERFDQEFVKSLVDPSPPNPVPILDSPTLSYDQSALALSFLPSLRNSDSIYQNYLQYRYSLYLSSAEFYRRSASDELVPKRGEPPPPSPRYSLPTSHISIARFIDDISPETLKSLANGLKVISGRGGEGNCRLGREVGGRERAVFGKELV